jgi:flagellar hook-associated protein 2
MGDSLGTLKSSTGIGSGIPIQELVAQLVDLEGRAKKEKLDSNETSTLAKITGFGNLKSSLSDFKTSLETLKDPVKFQTKKATVTNDSTVTSTTTYFTATATGKAASTNYTIEVEQLATSHKLGSSVFNTASTILGTGTLRLTVGDTAANQKSFDITIGEDDQTLSGISAAINARTATTGVSATLITSDAGVQLVLASNNTGVKNSLEVSITNDSVGTDIDNTGLSQLTYTAAVKNMTELIAAQDANVRIDGQLATISSNKLVDTIEGLTLELVKAEDGKVHTLAVTPDITAAKDSAQKFVDGFNDVVEIIGELTKFNPLDTSENGILIGDANIRNIESSLRTALGKIIVDPTGFTSLSSIGITTNATTGKLEIDDTKLTNALNSNIDAVTNLFSRTTDGIAVGLFTTVDNLVKAKGTVNRQTDFLKDDLKDIAEEKRKLDEKLQALEVRLTKQFASLDAILGELQQTTSQLTKQLSSFADPLSFRK